MRLILLKTSFPSRSTPSSLTSTYFKTVELNVANVSQYFTYEIIDTYDTWGNHNGAKVYLKLKPSDWYLANSKDLAIEYNLSFDYIDSNGIKGTYNELCMTENCVLSRGSWGYTQYDRNSVKILVNLFKFLRIKLGSKNLCPSDCVAVCGKAFHFSLCHFIFKAPRPYLSTIIQKSNYMINVICPKDFLSQPLNIRKIYIKYLCC